MTNFIIGFVLGSLSVLCIWKRQNIKEIIKKIKEKKQ